MRRWSGTVVFVVLVAAVLVAQAAIVAPELWLTRLWEDEAYNLTVPLNLLAGHGYTSDGILAPQGGLTPFDVRISTGPTVLLPVAGMLATGVDIVVGGRLVMLLFYAGLLVSLWFLGRRVAGRWGGLAALAAPLALNTNQFPSPIQGPLDVLGEIPSAMFLVLAFLTVRRRPWLAGLMLGLAVQTKFITALAIPVVILMAWFAIGGLSARRRAARTWPLVVAAAAPTIVYEAVVLVCLGRHGFIANTHDFLHFLKTGGQFGVHTSTEAKSATLLASWFIPGWAVVLMAVIALAAAAYAVTLLRRRPVAVRHRLLTLAGARAPARDVVTLLTGTAALLLIWTAWWTASGHTPDWIRYMAPAAFACVPVLTAATVLSVRVVYVDAGSTTARGVPTATPPDRRGSPWRTRVRPIAAVTVALLVAATLAAQATGHIQRAYQPDADETLPQQRVVAAQLAALHHTRLATQWGGQIGAIVLSGARVVSFADQTRGDTPLVLWAIGPNWSAVINGQRARWCRQTLLSVPHYLVCTPAS